MILEFNDTPEGLVVDVEVIAGIPFKGYDDRAPYDGYKMAAGMNELFTAPLLASQKGSYDWEESINAITRHVIEEFSNLQHFVPYLYEKCTLMGKTGINWIPTLGTWLQYHHKSVADGSSISWYHTLEKLARKQINTTSTWHGKLVDQQIQVLNRTIQAGTKMLTKANEHISKKTFVPVSNTLTDISFKRNQRRGATNSTMRVRLTNSTRAHKLADKMADNLMTKFLRGANVTVETVVSGGTLPHLTIHG